MNSVLDLLRFYHSFQDHNSHAATSWPLAASYANLVMVCAYSTHKSGDCSFTWHLNAFSPRQSPLAFVSQYINPVVHGTTLLKFYIASVLDKSPGQSLSHESVRCRLNLRCVSLWDAVVVSSRKHTSCHASFFEQMKQKDDCFVRGWYDNSITYLILLVGIQAGMASEVYSRRGTSCTCRRGCAPVCYLRMDGAFSGPCSSSDTWCQTSTHTCTCGRRTRSATSSVLFLLPSQCQGDC